MTLEIKGLLMRRAATVSVGVALFLVAIKAFAWFTSHSVALLASLADSALDLFASLMNLVAIRHSLTPADAEHRFGHGKAEPLAGLAQGAFIAASALFLILESVKRLMTPEPVAQGGMALAVMGISIAVTFGLVMYQRRVVSQTGSLAVAADRLHYAGDLLSNLGVVVALLLAGFLGWLWADPVSAIGVALILLHAAWGVARQSMDQLMDRELPDDDRARIRGIAESFPAVKGVHNLKTRQAGISTFIQFDIVLDAAMTLAQAHAVSDAVSAAIAAAWPGAQIVIHQDPEGQP
ncbi:MAG TPA: cation diffusion facilitator family transporter [Rhizomicrobium sp.]|nr:cation diffusion facilitator family transporter [Rhizomicrobium sp.]